jgi:steroid delta-isomerase-like uncharacterized protein
MTIISEMAAADTQAVEQLAARWEKAWNDHDADAVAAMCAEKLIYDEPALGETAYGRDAIRGLVRRLDRAIPDHRFEVVGVYADVARRSVLVAWRLTGTHARTGARLDFHGDDRLDLGPDGLIAEHRCLYDSSLVHQQVKQAAAA